MCLTRQKYTYYVFVMSKTLQFPLKFEGEMSKILKNPNARDFFFLPWCLYNGQKIYVSDLFKKYQIVFKISQNV